MNAWNWCVQKNESKNRVSARPRLNFTDKHEVRRTQSNVKCVCLQEFSYHLDRTYVTGTVYYAYT